MVIEGDNIYLRQLNFSDAPFIAQLVNTEEWLRYIGDKHVLTIEDAENYLLNGPMKSYTTNQFGLWLVLRKEDDARLGMCGLLKRDCLEFPDIGFAFLPEHTRQGYAKESVVASLKLAREHFNLPVVLAITTPDNHRSQRLLKSVEFQFDKVVDINGENLNLYSLHFKS